MGAKLFTMRTSNEIRSLLGQGDRRTVGHVAELVDVVLRKPKLVSALVECIFDADEGIRMRAADALEKISRKRVEELQHSHPPYSVYLKRISNRNSAGISL